MTLTYLRRELQRRVRGSLVTAAGLAVGVGLVVTLTAASAGVGNAQAAVLHSLYGIGTSVTVTTAPQPLSPGSPHSHLFSPGPEPQYFDGLGLVPDLGVLDASSVKSVARLPGVAAAAAGLTLDDTRLTVPSVSQLGPNGQPPAWSLHPPASFSVDGVDLAHPRLGPFGSGRIASGRTLAASDASSNVAVVDARYAAANHLAAGSTMTIAGAPFRVIGIVRQPAGGGAADVYIPLGRAQTLGQYQGQVSTIYVAAASASDIAAVRAEIAKLLPSATVTSSDSLANAVSGSLASAAGLIDDLGRWLAIAGLVVAFGVASLLTMAAVGRRVREIGTLKALGWPTRRIVAQVMGESLVIGVVGAAMGIGLGFAGAALVNASAPPLSATVAQDPGSALPHDVSLNSTGMHSSTPPDATHTVPVHLAAEVTGAAIALAVALAIAGALVAGAFGGWRAARLRPAEALAQVE